MKKNREIGAYLRRMARQADKGFIVAFAAAALHSEDGRTGHVRTSWFDNEGKPITIAGLGSCLAGETAWHTAKGYSPKKYPIHRRTRR